MESVRSKIHQLWGSSFVSKCSKSNLNLGNGKKNWENIFRFWDKSMWKFCNKLSLLGREYLPPTISGLTNSPKILYISKRDLSDWIDLSEINKYGKSKNIFHFWDNSNWKCCNKLPLLRREYLSWAVNELTNSRKILHIT